MVESTGAVWQKSARSGNSGNCVEVATNLLDTQGVVFVRDSKNPDGPVLHFTSSAWESFVDGAKQGGFNPAH